MRVRSTSEKLIAEEESVRTGMSTTTTRRYGNGVSTDVIASVDEPVFSVSFTPNASFASRTVPTNSFHWMGPATLRIGPHGVVVTARIRRLIWFRRTQQYFVPSSEIGTVYREGDNVRVELRGAASARPFFQFWADDARSAAAIVALLPTAETVEVEDTPVHLTGRIAGLLARAARGKGAREKTAPADARLSSEELSGITRVAVVSPFHAAWWTLGAATLVLAAAIAFFLLPHFIARSQIVPGITAVTTTTSPGVGIDTDPEINLAAEPETSTAPAVRTTEAEITRAESEYLRYEGRIEGLRTQFATALTALQSGTLEAPDFEYGLEKWLLPQWESLHIQLATEVPPINSPRSILHRALDDVTDHWQNALAIYVEGLRDGNPSRVSVAFSELKRAEEAERLAGRSLASIESAPLLATARISPPRSARP